MPIEPPPETKIREIMKVTGWKQQRLAETFNVSQSTVNRWLTGSEPEGHRRDAINQLYEETVAAPGHSDIVSVPMVGYVSDGAEVHFADGEPVPAPKNATKDTAALQIKGRSLGPFYDSWLVYYDDVRGPVTQDMISRDMSGPLLIVGLSDRVLVRKIQRSTVPGLFHLLGEDPILDVEIAWAAKVKSMVPR